jgi:hypothetical protein
MQGRGAPASLTEGSNPGRVQLHGPALTVFVILLQMGSFSCPLFTGLPGAKPFHGSYLLCAYNVLGSVGTQ